MATCRISVYQSYIQINIPMYYGILRNASQRPALSPQPMSMGIDLGGSEIERQYGYWLHVSSWCDLG
ncbi:hypothetical protein CP556_14655 [Natrinema sp. CBA1119]|nr:hypothetical protein CP556_14655 [Natrinema sp. CBA1119]